jgi:hypothetical protein
MKNTIITVALAACLLSLSCPVLAGNGDAAPKGWLVVRSGLATDKANYEKEDSDLNGKLERVSVLCANAHDEEDDIQDLIKTDKTRVWGANRGVSSTTTIINLGGSVIIDALKGNPNHCLVNGLTLSQIKGVWH